MEKKRICKITFLVTLVIALASVIFGFLLKNSTWFFNQNKNVLKNMSESIIKTTDGDFDLDGKEIVAKAAELLGTPYAYDNKGYNGAYYNGNYNQNQLYTASQIGNTSNSAENDNGIDCAGLIYWTLASLAKENGWTTPVTTGFAFNSPVPANTDNWLQYYQNGYGHYWNEVYQYSFNETTQTWEKESSSNGGSTSIYDANLTFHGKSINVLKINDFISEDLRYYEYYDADGNKKELPIGTIIASYGKGIGSKYNHTWIYIGDLGTSQAKEAHAKLESLLGITIPEEYVLSTSASTHWRIESAGGEGVTINNGDPNFGSVQYDVTSQGNTVAKGVGPVWAFQVANDTVEGTYHINVAKKSLNNSTGIDENIDLIPNVTFELTQQIYGSNVQNEKQVITSENKKQLVIFSGENNSETGEVSISQTGIGVGKPDTYTIKEIEVPEKYEDINDLLQNISIQVYKKQDGKKLKIDYIRINDENGTQIGEHVVSGKGITIEKGYDLDGDSKYDIGIVLNDAGSEFSIVVRNPEVTQEGYYKLNIAKKSRDKATTVEEGTASFSVNQIIDSNISTNVTATATVSGVPVVSEDSTESTAIEFNENDVVAIQSIGTDTYKIRETGVTGNYYIGEGWRLDLDVHKIEEEKTVDETTVGFYSVDYITISSTGFENKYNLGLDEGENRTTASGETIYNGTIKINTEGELVTDESEKYVVEINVKDTDADGIIEIDIVWTNPKQLTYNFNLVKKEMKSTDYIFENAEKNDPYILGDTPTNSGTAKSWINANTGDFVEGAVYGISRYDNVTLNDIQNFVNAFYNSANPGNGASDYIEITTNEEIQTVFSNISSEQTTAEHIYIIQELSPASGYKLNKNIFCVIVNFEKQEDSNLVINSVEVYCGVINNDGSITIQTISEEDILKGNNMADGSAYHASMAAETKYRVDYSNNTILFTAPDTKIEGNYDVNLIKIPKVSNSAINTIEEAKQNAVEGATYTVKQYLNMPINIDEETLEEYIPDKEITVITNSDGTLKDENGNVLNYLFEDVEITNPDLIDIYVIEEQESPIGYIKNSNSIYVVVRKTIETDSQTGLDKYVIGVEEGEFSLYTNDNVARDIELCFYKLEMMYSLNNFAGTNTDESEFLGSIGTARVDYSSNTIIISHENSLKTGSYDFYIRKVDSTTESILRDEKTEFNVTVYKTRTENSDGTVTYSDVVDLYNTDGEKIETKSLTARTGVATAIDNIEITKEQIGSTYYFVIEEVAAPEGYTKINYQVVMPVTFYEFTKKLGVSKEEGNALTEINNSSSNEITVKEQSLSEVATDETLVVTASQSFNTAIIVKIPNAPYTRYDAQVELNKLGSTEQQNIAGAKFKVTDITEDSDMEIAIYNKLSEENIEILEDGSFVVPEEGIILDFKELLANTTYQIQIEEIEAPDGYYATLQSLVLEISIDENEVVTAQIVKLINSDGNEVDTINQDIAQLEGTDENGTVQIGLNEQLENVTIQYKLGEDGQWQDYTEDVKVYENTTVYAKSIQDGVESSISFKVIDNIDKVLPTLESYTENDTGDIQTSIDIVLVDEATEVFGASGIVKYGISTSNEVEPDTYITANQETRLEATIEQIEANGIYYIWIWDKAGNCGIEEVEITTVHDDIYVAEITAASAGYEDLIGTQYRTLEAALAACPELGSGTATVSLIHEIYNESNEVNKEVTIDLNGYTLTSRQNTATLTVTENSTLTLINTQIEGGVVNENLMAILVNETGTFTMGTDDKSIGIVQPAITGIGVGVRNNGTFNFYDGNITALADYNSNSFAIYGTVTETPVVYSVSVEDYTEPEKKQYASLAIISGIEARIGRKTYVKLEEAIEDAGTVYGTDGSQVEIVIVSDLNKTDDVIVDETKNIKLDLDGHVVNFSTTAYNIINYGNLEIVDSSANSDNPHGDGDITNTVYNSYTLGEQVITYSPADLVSTSVYKFEEDEGKIVPNNNEAGTIAYSYIKIDLTDKEGDYAINVNASLLNGGYAYAFISTNEETPDLSKTNKSFMYTYSLVENTDFRTPLKGGKIYYLHLAYKHTSTEENNLIINKIKLNKRNNANLTVKSGKIGIQSGGSYNAANYIIRQAIHNEGNLYIENDNRDSKYVLMSGSTYKYQVTDGVIKASGNTARSYIEIDLTDKENSSTLTINADMISHANASSYSYYAYAKIKDSKNPSREIDENGRFMYMSNDNSTTNGDFSVVLEGGKKHYLHIEQSYCQIQINSIKLDDTVLNVTNDIIPKIYSAGDYCDVITDYGNSYISDGYFEGSTSSYASRAYGIETFGETVLSGGIITKRMQTAQNGKIIVNDGRYYHCSLYNYESGEIIVNNGYLTVYNYTTTKVTINGGVVSAYNNSSGVIDINTADILNINNSSETGIVNIKDSTVYNTKTAIVNSGIVNVYGETSIESNTDVAISNTGTLNIGVNDGEISNTAPSITGPVGIESTGVFNFYDGIITADENSTIDGAVNEIADGSDLLVKMVNEKEIAKLQINDTPVAQIEETTYVSLQDAINAVSEGTDEATTIELLTDFTTAKKIIVPENKNIIIDFNQYTIKVFAQGNTFENNGILSFISDTDDTISEIGGIISTVPAEIIKNNNKLKINDITISQTGVRANIINNAGDLEINSGEIPAASCIYNSSTGNITINGGNIKSSYIDNVGGNIVIENGVINTRIASTGGNIKLNNGTINNTSVAMSLDEGAIFEINGGTINHTTSYSVNSFNVNANSKLIINDGTISYTNTYRTTYNAIQVNENGYFEMNGGKIETNAIGINNIGKTIINSGNITAGNRGITNSGNLTVLGGEIYGNTDSGIYTTANTVTIGKKDNTSNNATPFIYGEQYGVKIADGAIFNFYDGCIEGLLNQSISGTVAELEDGYEIILTPNDENTRETATLDNLPVAKIISTGTEYYDLQTAINNCEDNTEETIQLLRNTVIIETVETIEISENKNIILDLNGYKISAGNEDPIIVDGKLTIKSSDESEAGILEGTKSTLITLNGNAELNVESGNIGPIYNNASNGILHITGGTVENIYNNATAKENPEENNIIIDGGTVGEIYNNQNGRILINNVTMENKTSIGYAIYNNSTGEITINNCNITAATTASSTETLNSNYNLAAIVNKGGGTVNINGGTITANEKMSGICNFYGTLNIAGGTIICNDTGITIHNKSLYGNSTTNISGGTISSTMTTESSTKAIPYYATILNEQNAILNITGGTIATEHVSIQVSNRPYVIHNTAVLNLGTDDEKIENDNIKIIGVRYGIVNADNATFNYYDGTIQGYINCAVAGTITDMPENTELSYDRNEAEIVSIGTESVAMIGDTYYNTLREAINSCSKEATTSTTITILKDIGIGAEEYTISEGQNIVIDLNGNKINQYAKFVNNGTLEFLDSTEEKLGSIETTYRLIDNTGILKINDITINYTMPENSTLEDRILINNSNNGSIEILSGNINYQYKGYGLGSVIYTTSSNDIKLLGGTIETDLEAVRVIDCDNESCNILIDGITINTGAAHGIYMRKTANVVAKSGSINSDEYGIYSNVTTPTGSLTIQDGFTITGIYTVGFYSTIINGGNITGEAYIGNSYTTEINGGIIEWIDARGNITINDGEIHFLSSYSIYANVTMLGGIIDNSNSEYGSAGANISSGTFTMGTKDYPVSTTSPVIKGKTYGVSGTFNFYDGIITGNTAAIEATTDTIDVPDLYKIVFSENATVATLGPDNTVEQVVSVNNVYYTSLESAIIAATTSTGTIVVHKDIVLESPVTISTDQDITINLNANNITYEGEDSAITNNGTLTIIDSVEETEEEIIQAKIENTQGVAITNNGTLTIGIDDGIVDTTTPNIIGTPEAITNNGTLNTYDGLINGAQVVVGTSETSIIQKSIYKLAQREKLSADNTLELAQSIIQSIIAPTITVDKELPEWTNDSVTTTIVAKNRMVLNVVNEAKANKYLIKINKVDEEGNNISDVSFNTVGIDEFGNELTSTEINSSVVTNGTEIAQTIVESDINVDNASIKDIYTITETDAPIYYSKLAEELTVAVTKTLDEAGENYIVSSYTINGQEADSNGTITLDNIALEGTDEKATIKASITDNVITIIAENKVKTIDKSVEKVWVDENNKYGNRPESIEVTLYKKTADGNVLYEDEEIENPVNLNEENDWSYTWNYLPKYENETEVEYIIEETGELKGYTSGSEVVDNTTTITNSMETTQITVEKYWDGIMEDDANDYKTTFELYKTTDEIIEGNKISTTKTAVTDDNGDVLDCEIVGNGTYVFDNLPKYENGNIITYIAEETKIEKLAEDGVTYEELSKDNFKVTTNRLADVVEVGDYVAYDELSGGEYSYKTDESLTGNSAISEFSNTNDMSWRVLSVDKETGFVDLVAADETTAQLMLTGQTGYINSKQILNDIGAIYGHGDGAIIGRSIDIEDLNKYSSYDPSTYANSYSSTGYYGGTRTYTSGTFIKEDGSSVTATTAQPYVETQTSYTYDATYVTPTLISDMLFKDTSGKYNKYYWLNSQGAQLYSNFVSYAQFCVYNGISNVALVTSTNSSGSSARYVLPVVSLQSNIQTTGQDSSGAWILSKDNTTIKVTNTPITEKSVEKVWDDNDDEQNLRPTSINVGIYTKDGDEYVLYQAKGTTNPVTLNEGNNWSYTWPNLPKYNDSVEIEYTIKETEELSNYTIFTEVNNNTTIITNTVKPVPTQRTIQKVWSGIDEETAKNYRVTFKLYRYLDGTKVEVLDENGEEVTKTIEGNGTATFDNLVKYENGELIKYVAEEILIERTPDNGTTWKEVSKDNVTFTTNSVETLADLVSVGDYVNYDASSGESVYTYTTDSSLTGNSSGEVFSSSDSMKWRVLSVDEENKVVQLIAADGAPNTISLAGVTGYRYGIKVLDDISSVYGHGKGATSARSIKIEDIELYSTFDKSTVNYGATQTYTSGTFYAEDGTEIIASTSNPVTMTQTFYSYNLASAYEDTDKLKLICYGSDGTTYKNYYIASRAASLGSTSCGMFLYGMNNGNQQPSIQYAGSSGSTYMSNVYVRPVVTLEAELLTSGQDENGAWNIGAGEDGATEINLLADEITIVTNEFTRIETERTVKKVWDIPEDEINNYEATLTLYKIIDGEKSVVVDSEGNAVSKKIRGNGTVQFEELLKYENGILITYCIEETEVKKYVGIDETTGEEIWEDVTEQFKATYEQETTTD